MTFARAVRAQQEWIIIILVTIGDNHYRDITYPSTEVRTVVRASRESFTYEAHSLGLLFCCSSMLLLGGEAEAVCHPRVISCIMGMTSKAMP